MTAPQSTGDGKTSPLSEQDLQKLAALAKAQAERVIRQIPVLGAVAWLMMQQNSSRHTLLSDLEWRVMPPLVLDQAKLYMRENSPIAYVSWARLSEEAAQRYRSKPHHLTASDWQSGDQVWLVDLYAPFGGTQEVMKDLCAMFAGKEIFQLAPEAGNSARVLTWPAAQKPE